MSVRFTLEKRTNMYGECPIRLSWSFGGQRYQTTLGFSVAEADWDETRRLMKPETHNKNGQSADDVNYYIKRIRHVVACFERYFVGNEKALTKEMMKLAVGDTMSNDIAHPEDIIERCTEGIISQSQPETTFYRDEAGRYYKLICDARKRYNTDRYIILQELFGRRDRLIIPKDDCKPQKIPGQMYRVTKFTEVSVEEVYGL